MRLHTQVHMYTHKRVYVNVFAYIYTHIHIYIYIHIHMHIYTHTCTHIYKCMHMHTCAQLENLSDDASTCHVRKMLLRLSMFFVGQKCKLSAGGGLRGGQFESAMDRVDWLRTSADERV